MDARPQIAEALLRAESPREVAEVVAHELAAAAGACRARLAHPSEALGPAVADAAAGEPVWLGAAAALDARYPAWAADAQQGGARAWAALPITVGSKRRAGPLGVLWLEFAHDQGFEPAQQRELRGLVQLVALALDRAELIERQQAIVRFSDEQLGVFAHDLRSPLGAIALTADTMLTGQPDAVARKRFELILRGTRRMERMLKQMVDYARSRHGTGLRMNTADVSLTELAREAADEARARTGRAVELSGDGDARGTWDGERLGQAVAHVVDNAVEHGTADVPVAIQVDGTDADRVRLRVTSGGVIDAAVVPNVFEPFRGNRPRTKTSGLGLGLPLARTIVEAHGGTITCASSAEGGTSFLFDLPRRPASGRRA